MPIESARRVDSKIDHNLFWMIDSSGKYGLYLKAESEFVSTEIDIKLRGIDLIKRNYQNCGELFLILNNQEDWELFAALCRDIFNACSEHAIDFEMIEAVENRLRRWQFFLMRNNGISMSYEKQMGLFAELQFLKYILIPKKGSFASVTAWTGPASDKQDYALPELSVEVKSYRSSNGPIVAISSAHQLLTDSKPLYLVSYGLTEDIKGGSVQELIEEFTLTFALESLQILQLFEEKIMDFGYMPGIEYNNMYKFKVDCIRSFLIENDFPRILPNEIAPEIVSVNYSVDLALCIRFEIDSNNLL